MQSELSKYLMHLSGLIFVFLAQFTGGIMIAAYSFMVACSFLLYSELVLRQQKRIEKINSLLVSGLETNTNSSLGMERKEVRPFIGAFWFYFAFGITFMAFPISIACAACAMLAVADCLSTLGGRLIGKHRIVGNKTIEGSLVFLVSAFLMALIFINPVLALIGSATAMFAELVPGISLFRKSSIVDDNLLIPLIASVALLIVSSI